MAFPPTSFLEAKHSQYFQPLLTQNLSAVTAFFEAPNWAHFSAANHFAEIINRTQEVESLGRTQAGLAWSCHTNLDITHFL